MKDKILNLPNHRPNFASGLCNAVCITPVLLVYLITEAIGVEMSFGALVGSTIFSQLMATILHVQWINLAKQRKENGHSRQ